MIWHTIVNILWALVRNAFQKGHRCLALNQLEGQPEWGWECSCGAWGDYFESELRAIEDYRFHIQGQQRASRRFEESMAIEGLVNK